MEELLKFVEYKINKVGKRKLYTMDEDGNEIECYDGECIYSDGVTEGLYSAYTEIRDKIIEIMK